MDRCLLSAPAVLRNNFISQSYSPLVVLLKFQDEIIKTTWSGGI